jgi:hypothetical protein
MKERTRRIRKLERGIYRRDEEKRNGGKDTVLERD